MDHVANRRIVTALWDGRVRYRACGQCFWGLFYGDFSTSTFKIQILIDECPRGPQL